MNYFTKLQKYKIKTLIGGSNWDEVEYVTENQERLLTPEAIAERERLQEENRIRLEREEEDRLRQIHRERMRDINLEIKEKNYKKYKHLIDQADWKETAFDQFIDPVTLDLYNDPYIASDGMTYSHSVLTRMFESPNPRGVNGIILVRINGDVGIPNLVLNSLLNKFKEGKLKISEN